MFKAARIVSIVLVMGLLFALTGCAANSSSSTSSSNYPTSAIHIVVAMAAGGSTDIVARTLQPFLSKYIGVPVVIDNVPAAGGKVGISQVYRARPDGYELLLGAYPAWLITQKTDNTADYDLLKMVHLYNISAGDYNVIAVPYNSPIKTLADLKSASRSKQIKMSGSGLGTNSYLSYIFLKNDVQANIQYIPYNSGTEAVLALVGNHVDASVGSVISFEPLVKQNKVRLIAETGPKRIPAVPDVPTLVEKGYQNASFDILLGVDAPPGLPGDIAGKLETALAKAINDPAFKQTAAKANFTVAPMDTNDYTQAVVNSNNVVQANLNALIAASS